MRESENERKWGHGKSIMNMFENRRENDKEQEVKRIEQNLPQ